MYIKKILFIKLFLLLISMCIISCRSVSVVDLDGISDVIKEDDGKSCFIFGAFRVKHVRLDPLKVLASGADWAYAKLMNAIPQDHYCGSSISIVLIDTNNEEYTIKFKPITGSDLVYYGSREEELSRNIKDPYWFIKVNPGSYQVKFLRGGYNCSIPGYKPMYGPTVNAPLSKYIKRSIDLNTKEKQIIYIGDYDIVYETIFKEYTNSLLRFHNVEEVKLTNNFEAAKK